MAHPMRVDPWSAGKPPEAVRQASGSLLPIAPEGNEDEDVCLPVTQLLLTAEQAASALSICRTKVYELLRTGQLESVQIGSSRRIPVAALDEFVVRLRNTSNFTYTGEVTATVLHEEWLIQLHGRLRMVNEETDFLPGTQQHRAESQ